MTEHVEAELTSLLTGELSRKETIEVAAHLDQCSDCARALIATSVAHGSLLAVVKAGAVPRDVGLSAGPPDRELSSTGAVGKSGESDVQPRLRYSPRARQRRVRIAAVAAAVILIAAAAVGIALARRGPGTPIPPVAALASLHHLDAPAQAAGVVTVRAWGETREMLITTERLPKLAPNQFYEVWLLQPSTNKMLPVGVLPPSGSGSFELAGAVMSQFSAIDVSLQANNGNPAHSSRSVLRGSVETVTT